MTRVTSFVLAISLTALTSGFAEPAQTPGPTRISSVVGQVLDAGTKAPVSQADVVLTGAGLKATTDNDGRFALADVPAAPMRSRSTGSGTWRPSGTPCMSRLERR